MGSVMELRVSRAVQLASSSLADRSPAACEPDGSAQRGRSVITIALSEHVQLPHFPSAAVYRVVMN